MRGEGRDVLEAIEGRFLRHSRHRIRKRGQIRSVDSLSLRLFFLLSLGLIPLGGPLRLLKVVIVEDLIEVALPWLLSQELIVTAGLLLDGDGLLDDHEEVRVILEVVVSLFVLPQHEVADADIVIELLLAVYPVLKDGL